MQKYQCHKIVQAAKIIGIVANTKESIIAKCDDGQDYVLPVARINIADILEPGKSFGYVVRYEDGYTSWSPAEPFETGYTLIEDVYDAG